MPKRKQKEEDGSEDEVKYKGVYPNNQKFGARIRIDGKLHYPGTFDTAKEAAREYDRVAMQAGRPIDTLNFQDQVPKSYKSKKKKLISTNTSGYRGVTKNGNRFQAQIRNGGKNQHIGSFGTTKEAAIAYDLAAIQAKRSKSDLNFPDMNHAKKIKKTKKTNKTKTNKTKTIKKKTIKKKTIKKNIKKIKKKKVQVVPIIQIKKKRKMRKSSTTKSKNYSIKTASREFPI